MDEPDGTCRRRSVGRPRIEGALTPTERSARRRKKNQAFMSKLEALRRDEDFLEDLSACLAFPELSKFVRRLCHILSSIPSEAECPGARAEMIKRLEARFVVWDAIPRKRV